MVNWNKFHPFSFDVSSVFVWTRWLVLGWRRTTPPSRASPAAQTPPRPPLPTAKSASWSSCRPPRQRWRASRSSMTSERSPPPSPSIHTTRSSARARGGAHQDGTFYTSLGILGVVVPMLRSNPVGKIKTWACIYLNVSPRCRLQSCTLTDSLTWTEACVNRHRKVVLSLIVPRKAWINPKLTVT